MEAVTEKQEPHAGAPGPKPASAIHAGGKERYVREMFAAVASRYDLLNAVLSFNRDRSWRRLAVRLAGVRRGDRCLDVCTGTGAFAQELASAAGDTGVVIGADFCEPMLRSGLPKVRRAPGAPITMMAANAENLPYSDNTFDVVTVGFGIRNVARIEHAVRALARVARPGGRVVILEFNRPYPAWYRPLVDFYLFQVLPRIGGLLSRREAYTYLPESMKQFVSREELTAVMERSGLRDIRVHDLNFCTVCIHLGVKPAETGWEQAT